ncbi:MAG: short chain dehydrogenase [Anaerolineales bacterium]|jgi:NAD(P)-dependent dehydrogenase (short-subunit alcohol dehydrogenase family)
MKVVVVGATGLIGKAVTDLLSEKGHEIVRASRHSQPGVDITDPASIGAFYKAIGKVDAIISASAGTSSYATVSELTDEGIDQDLKSKLMGQVNLVRQGLSKVRTGGVFILTGGIFAYNPWPKSSVIAMVNLGLQGFARGAALDLKDTHRIVVIHPPAVREWAIKMGMDGAPWPVAATVAETYLEALEGSVSGQAVFVDGYGPA